ncbi:hypothetical protein RB597_005021 [Gaeumannomyces tritici]
MAGPVRHPIDVAALEAYVRSDVPAVSPPLEVRQFGFGQSNPTYQLTDARGARWVLRKKPPGRLVSKTAHQVEREHRVISALSSSSPSSSSSSSGGGGGVRVPVPRPVCLCEDPSVVGTPFYIMEFLDGRIFEDPAMPEVGARERAALWADAVRTLARLHSVDVDAVGLGDGKFGRKGRFFERQVRTWKGVCDAQAAARDVDSGEPVGQLPRYEELVGFFEDEALRPRDRVTLVHGDYKIDNLVFHKTEPRVIGILDWEMSTIGHPLSDLANLFQPFETAGLPTESVHTAHGGFVPGATPGLPTRDEAAELYRATVPAGWWRTAAEMAPELRWAQAFNMFRSAAVCQGIAARVAARQASSAQARRYAEGRGPLAEFAWTMVERAREAAAGAARAKI